MFCVKLLEKYLDLFKQCVIFAFGNHKENVRKTKRKKY